MANIFSWQIPDDCSTDNMPALEAITCQTPRNGEICDLILRGSADGPTDMSSSSDWSGLIDNTDTTGAKMKRFSVRGGLSEPDRLTVDMPKRSTKTFDKVYTATFEVLDLGGTNYTFLQALEAKRFEPDFYFITIAGWMFGEVDASNPDNGIEALNYDVDFLLAQGEVEKCIITIQFRADTFPDRVVSPL